MMEGRLEEQSLREGGILQVKAQDWEEGVGVLDGPGVPEVQASAELDCGGVQHFV